MPLYKTIHNDDKTTIGIWKIKETVRKLKDQLPYVINQENINKKYSSSLRLKQWLATRILLSVLTKSNSIRIHYNRHNKPYLDISRSISISHSGAYVSVILSDSSSVGIDIQVIKKNIIKGQSLFMTPEEGKEIGTNNIKNKLHIYWAAKEALYKYVGDSQLNIYSDFIISPFNLASQCELKGIIPSLELELGLKYSCHPEYYLVYTI